MRRLASVSADFVMLLGTFTLVILGAESGPMVARCAMAAAFMSTSSSLALFVMRRMILPIRGMEIVGSGRKALDKANVIGGKTSPNNNNPDVPPQDLFQDLMMTNNNNSTAVPPPTQSQQQQQQRHPQQQEDDNNGFVGSVLQSFLNGLDGDGEVAEDVIDLELFEDDHGVDIYLGADDDEEMIRLQDLDVLPRRDSDQLQ